MPILIAVLLGFEEFCMARINTIRVLLARKNSQVAQLTAQVEQLRALITAFHEWAP